MIRIGSDRERNVVDLCRR